MILITEEVKWTCFDSASIFKALGKVKMHLVRPFSDWKGLGGQANHN